MSSLRSRFHLLSAALLTALAAACAPGTMMSPGDGSGPPTDAASTLPDGDSPAPASGALPCGVGQVLAARCVSCHASTPLYGAPMPLVTYADTQAPARSDPSVRVWQMMQRRVHDAAHPMPATGMLAPAELAPLDAWFAASAPPAAATDPSCGDAGPTPTPDAGPVGPSALPCTPDQTFVAHGDTPGSPYHVPSTAGNLYWCFSWRVPFTTPVQQIAYAPITGDARVLHHWILYQTAVAQPEGGSFPCNGHMPADATFVDGWAPGGGNHVMPPDVGQQLPGNDHYFILQVHYHNTAGLTDALDASGVAMCTTTTLRPHSAAVSTLGTLNISIPAHTADYATTGMCTPTMTEPVHVLSAGPHMHTHGTSFVTEVLRAGTGAVETLVSVPHWDFDSQTSYDSSMVLNPGDRLRTTCHYANTGDTPVTFGENTENEMCFDFVLAWPAGALVNAIGRTRNACIDFGR